MVLPVEPLVRGPCCSRGPAGAVSVGHRGTPVGVWVGIVDFGGVGGPVHLGNLLKRWGGFALLLFWKVSRPPGAAQIPKSMISGRSKSHILKAQVCGIMRRCLTSFMQEHSRAQQSSLVLSAEGLEAVGAAVEPCVRSRMSPIAASLQSFLSGALRNLFGP